MQGQPFLGRLEVCVGDYKKWSHKRGGGNGSSRRIGANFFVTTRPKARVLAPVTSPIEAHLASMREDWSCMDASVVHRHQSVA